MDDVIKYFRYAMLFPIIVAIFVAIVIIPFLYNGNYEIVYGNGTYNIGQSFSWPTPRIYNYIITIRKKKLASTRSI